MLPTRTALLLIKLFSKLAGEAAEKEWSPVPIILRGNGVPCDWRIDTDASTRDWTIHVQSCDLESKPSVSDYHVHLNMICLEPRSSQYFYHLCNRETSAFIENTNRTSQIELHPLAAAQFPIMLDYLYRHNLRIDDDNAIVLLYLAKYFDCKAMLREVNDYCDYNLNDVLSHCGTTYKHANIFEFADVVSSVVALCVQYIDDLRKHYEIVNEAGPDFWLAVLSKVSVTPVRSAHLSELVASVCQSHKDKLDKDVFDRLTEQLTHVSPRCASALRGLELELIPPTTSPPTSVTRLQTMCIAALAEEVAFPGHAGLVQLQLPEGCPTIVYYALLKETRAAVENSLKNQQQPLAENA
jgi:hypothetical protein